MNIKRTILSYLFAFLAFGIAFAAGFWVHGYMYPTTVHFPVLSQAYKLIYEHGYGDPPPDPSMEYGAIRGMVGAYGDPFTRFSEPVQAELQNDTLSGSYGGIGAQMGRDGEGYVVLHPFPDSPATEAGLMDGDRLLQVDEMEITPELPMEEIVAAVRGPEGKNVTLVIARPPEYTEMEFRVKRANIPLPSVTWYLDPNESRLGILQVNIIAASTPDEIQEAVNDLESRGATHFALDLRNNGGGLLNEGVDITRLFLIDGVIIQQQSKGEAVQSSEVKKPGALMNIPLVVLVNENTASAAEIISGALQAHNRAPLIGTHTFGKDSVQLVFELNDKSNLHVTSAKWWIPDLDPPVGEGGLQPDIAVTSENTEDADPYIEAAIQHFFGNQ
jgi:carboxyl-terminal processing protease